MTDQVESIFMEAFGNRFRLATGFPGKFLVNLVDNLGVFHRDYQDQYPRLLPLLAAACESA